MDERWEVLKPFQTLDDELCIVINNFAMHIHQSI